MTTEQTTQLQEKSPRLGRYEVMGINTSPYAETLMIASRHIQEIKKRLFVQMDKTGSVISVGSDGIDGRLNHHYFQVLDCSVKLSWGEYELAEELHSNTLEICNKKPSKRKATRELLERMLS